MKFKRRTLVLASIPLLFFLLMTFIFGGAAFAGEFLLDPGTGVALLLFAAGLIGTITMVAVIAREIRR